MVRSNYRDADLWIGKGKEDDGIPKVILSWQMSIKYTSMFFVATYEDFSHIQPLSVITSG